MRETLASEVRENTWLGEATRLDKALAVQGLVRSRSQANEFIAAGAVCVNNTVINKSGVKVTAGDVLSVRGADHFVSRAAHKLVAGLHEFDVTVANKRCADIGASTGGFTQVLLENGASEVFAIDVGHDQLDPLIRTDNRVRVFEGCNAREMSRETFGFSSSPDDGAQVIVADLSFISLRLVLSSMVEIATTNADFVLLVKPQFEVGRLGVKGGIVTDPLLASESVLAVLQVAQALGLGVHGIISSPIAGSYGNHEFVVHFSRQADLNFEAWEDTIRDLANATIGKVSAGNTSTGGSDN